MRINENELLFYLPKARESLSAFMFIQQQKNEKKNSTIPRKLWWFFFGWPSLIARCPNEKKNIFSVFSTLKVTNNTIKKTMKNMNFSIESEQLCFEYFFSAFVIASVHWKNSETHETNRTHTHTNRSLENIEMNRWPDR